MPAQEETDKPAGGRKYTPSKEIPYRQAVISLVIGDVLVFLIFVIIGDSSHQLLNGLASIPHIVGVALPFIVGWFVVSPFMGLFRREIFTQPRVMAIRTALAWIPAWVIAVILRGIFIDHHVPGTAFMIIALLFNLALLEIWRWPFTLNNVVRKRSLQQQQQP